MRSIRLLNLKITNVKNNIVYFDVELEYTWLWMINTKREYRGFKEIGTVYRADTGKPFWFIDLHLSNAISAEVNRLID